MILIGVKPTELRDNQEVSQGRYVYLGSKTGQDNDMNGQGLSCFIFLLLFVQIKTIVIIKAMN